MNYCLYKLKFTTGVHIGDDNTRMSLASSEMGIHADTVFSALCIEALQCGGNALLDELLELVKENKLLFSDALPYKDEEYYLPKPIKTANTEKEHSNSSIKKKIKALMYIPASQYKSYIKGLKGKSASDSEIVNPDFGSINTITKVAIKGIQNNEGVEETRPYHVGAFRFFDECGLYLIACTKGKADYELFNKLLNSLSYSGIGGKRTSGLGKFEVTEVDLEKKDNNNASLMAIREMLAEEKASMQISLSVALPKDEELDSAIENASYSLIRRGGFVQSQEYADTPMKKRVQYFFAPGSCFVNRFSGEIYDVSNNGGHPVYRYAKPVFLGVNL